MHPTEEEVRDAYKIISRHLNTCFMEDGDPLLDCLRREHPTLQMNLLRMLKKACEPRVIVENGEVTWYDGRYGKPWADFVATGNVPFI